MLPLEPNTLTLTPVGFIKFDCDLCQQKVKSLCTKSAQRHSGLTNRTESQGAAFRKPSRDSNEDHEQPVSLTEVVGSLVTMIFSVSKWIVFGRELIASSPEVIISGPETIICGAAIVMSLSNIIASLPDLIIGEAEMIFFGPEIIMAKPEIIIFKINKIA